MKRDLSNLTDEQVLELAKAKGDAITKHSLALFDNPSEFYTNKNDVDYKEAYRLLRKALREGKTFSVGLTIPDKGVSKNYYISVF